MHYFRARLDKTRYGSAPRWMDGVRVAYHKYGLKYLALFVALSAYSFAGAGVFLFFEKPAEIERVSKRQRTFEDLRQNLVSQLLDNLFNDTEKPIIFVDAGQIEAISRTFGAGLRAFEEVLNEYNSKHSMEPLLRWDMWTALIYAWTVITTIGYGHLFPLTVGGRIATMLYAVIGIPLMLTVLSNVGKLLTKGMKYPFFLIKRWARRIFGFCLKMTPEQMMEADAKDRSRLEVFDLPIPVAIALVIGWIFICSAITLIWEQEWDYLVAFYFFFISLSTIGFGDVVPSQPYYLLLMFGNTMIGMALLSMLLNLIQGKLEPIAIIEEEQDPFEMDRNGLRRALRRASMFTNMPWMAQQQQQTSGSIRGPLAIGAPETPIAGEISLKVPTMTNRPIVVEAGTRGFFQRRKKSSSVGVQCKPAKQQDGMTGGAAVSALSAFLAPLFSAMAPPAPTQAEEGTAAALESTTEKQGLDPSQAQLSVINETETQNTAAPTPVQKAEKAVDEAEAKADQPIKTVSFEPVEDPSRSPGSTDPVPTSRTTDTTVVSYKPPVPVRALIKPDKTAKDRPSGSSVRIHRLEAVASLDRPKRRKQPPRTMSMRDVPVPTGSSETVARSQRRSQKRSENSLQRSPRRKTPTHAPPVSEPSISIEEKSRKISSVTLPPPEITHSPGRSKNARLKRADTTAGSSKAGPRHVLLRIDDGQDTHSVCSICEYDPLTSTEMIHGRSGSQKQARSIYRDGSDLLALGIDEPPASPPRPHRDRFRHPRRRTIQRQDAVDLSLDTLPNDEAELFACLDAAIAAEDASRTRRPHREPWTGSYPRHRHSLDTVPLDLFRANTLPSLILATARDRPYLSAAQSGSIIVPTRSSETQTMISFPSQDSGSRISISGDRGTSHLLPENVQFAEINRLVNLNIKAELLRNELTELAAAAATAAAEEEEENLSIVVISDDDAMDAYQHVLSLREMIEQVNHEATLPRGV